MALGTVGFMIGTGGSALVSMTLGQGKKELANQYFSLLVYTSAGFSLFLSILGFLFTPQILLPVNFVFVSRRRLSFFLEK